MAVPATLSSVPDVAPYIQYVATSGQTVFPYPFPITQDADLVVVVNGVTQATDSTYSVSGVGNSQGGNVTRNSGSTGGDIITLYRNIQIERISQIAQNSGFSSTVFNNEFNNFYLIAQQLQTAIAQCLQIPNTNNPAPTTTLTSANYANKYLAFDSNGNPTPAALTSSGSLTGSLIAGLLSLVTGSAPTADKVLDAAEIAAGVTPSNFAYPVGHAFRYGMDPTFIAASDTALANLIAVSECAYTIGTSTSIGRGQAESFIPTGYYRLTTNATATAKFVLRGDGPAEVSSGTRLVQTVVNKDTLTIDPTVNSVSFSYSLDNLSFVNTAGAGTGIFVNVKRNGNYAVNSQRITKCVFASPQAMSMLLTGDDILVDGCLWDVSGYSGNAVQIGTTTQVATNVRFNMPNFYNVPTRCFQLINVDGLTVNGIQVSNPSGSSTGYLFDAATTVPTLCANVGVTGGKLTSVQAVLAGAGITNFAMIGVIGETMGVGAGETVNMFQMTGTNSGFTVLGCQFGGAYGSQNWYDDSGGTVALANITNNNFVASSGSGKCLNAANTTGSLGPNNYSGFTRNVTATNYLSAGVIPSAPTSVNFTGTVATDASLTSNVWATATSGESSATIGAPTNPSVGQKLRYTIINSSGSTITTTWNTAFHMSAWTDPANGKNRSIEFEWFGSDWVQVSQTGVDVPN